MSESTPEQASAAEKEAAVRKSKAYWWLPHAVAATVALCSSFWQRYVSTEVPDPYLDEVFHIRQAQTYCAGRYTEWDPKITTPPGLYLLDLPFSLIGLSNCSVRSLRSINLTLLAAVGFTAFRFLARRSWNHAQKGMIPLGDLLNDAHAAVNLCLFPPMFFFSALYYTDIASTLMVMLFLDDFFAKPTEGARFSLSQLAMALFALLMRQTNIFWVAIMPAAIDVIAVVKSEKLWKTPQAKAQSIYDRAIEDATFEDYIKLPFVVASDALRTLSLVTIAIPQHVFVLTAFGAFVAWNEGVVLGDKSNHVPTIHLPQMLYIWPYITFFSFPVIIPYVVDMMYVTSTRGISAAGLPGYGLLLILSGFAALIVYFNTIVHPFTLADNRHYTFYVFRQLLRNSFTKYGATVIYVIAGWLSLRRMGARPSAEDTATSQNDAKPAPQKQSETNTVPTVFVWLITTALSLITAPLVEPRYFIIPWVVWRLLLPPSYRVPADTKPTVNKVTGKENGEMAMALKQQDGWMWLETLWFVFLNVVTGYVFLYKPFVWPQEPFDLQRFMW